MKTLLFTLILGLCACAAQTATRASEPAHSKSDCDCAQGCPMALAGVQAAYEDSADGAAIVFSTERDEVSELQARVAKMAEEHNEPRPQRGPGYVAHSARVDNVEKGARLVMTPADPNELEALRKHVREHVETIQRGEAPTRSCDKQ